MAAPRAGRFSRKYLEGVVSVFWKILRVHVQEVRTFRRFPRHLRMRPAVGPGLRVILYGLPYGDWNAALADPKMWQDLGVVSEVRRVPGFRGLLPRATERTVLIPMKTSHTVEAPRDYRSLIPDRRTALILADKDAFYSYMVESGFGAYVPATYASPGEALFPCVAKRLDLSASIGVEIATTRTHLEEILQSRLFNGRPFLLQAVVPGTLEYATYCICDGGRILWSSTFVSTMGGPAMIKNEDNGKDRRIVTTPVEVLKQFETVLAPLGYRGPCVIDYKIAGDGRVQIFEINPRLGGTLLLESNAGLLREALSQVLAAAR